MKTLHKLFLNLKKGRRWRVSSKMKEGMTSPPKQYTEGQLISIEKNKPYLDSRLKLNVVILETKGKYQKGK
jgi:hypothetical protein